MTLTDCALGCAQFGSQGTRLGNSFKKVVIVNTQSIRPH
jgi:hypothetical protein